MLSQRQQQALDDLHHNLQMKGGWVQKVAVMILTATTVFPALMMAGFMEGLGWLSVPLGLFVAAVGGAVAGAIFYPGFRFWYVGLLCGGIIGVSSLVATFLYVLPRDEIYNIEVMIPLFLGALPGFGLYYLLMRTLLLSSAAAEDAADVDDDDEYDRRRRRRRRRTSS